MSRVAWREGLKKYVKIPNRILRVEGLGSDIKAKSFLKREQTPIQNCSYWLDKRLVGGWLP